MIKRSVVRTLAGLLILCAAGAWYLGIREPRLAGSYYKPRTPDTEDYCKAHQDARNLTQAECEAKHPHDWFCAFRKHRGEVVWPEWPCGPHRCEAAD